MLLGLIAVLVLSTGTVAAETGASVVSAPDLTENARIRSLQAAERLRADLTAVAAVSEPVVGKQLRDAAEMLRQHIELLTIETTWPSGRPEGTGNTAGTESTGNTAGTERTGNTEGTEGAAGPEGTTAPAPAAGLANAVTALAANGRLMLTEAASLKPGMARLLAGLGAAQQVQALELARVARLPEPELSAGTSPAGPAATALAGSALAGAAQRECGIQRPAASGYGAGTPAPAAVEAADAVTAVVVDERRLVYAYQIVAAKMGGAGGAQGAAALPPVFLAVHQQLVRQWETVARAECAALPPAPAGYVIPPELATGPVKTLAHAELELAVGYGDLISFSHGTLRRQAIEALLAAAQRSHALSLEVPHTPGLAVSAIVGTQG